MNRITILIGSVLLCAAKVLAQTPEQSTVKNLQSAYQGESGAVTFYRQCAKQAMQEGHPDVAKLFRAAAASEEIHRENHMRALRQIGATVPSAKPPAEVVKTTRQNLSASAADERQECRVMYPDYYRTARQQNVPAAMQTFRCTGSRAGAHGALPACLRSLRQEACHRLLCLPDLRYDCARQGVGGVSDLPWFGYKL